MSDKVLKFYANWCSPCKALSKSLEGVDLGIPIEEVDIDKYSDAAVEYGIRSVPTMVLIRNGSEVKRFSGVKPVDEIKQWVGQ